MCYNVKESDDDKKMSINVGPSDPRLSYLHLLPLDLDRLDHKVHSDGGALARREETLQTTEKGLRVKGWVH